MDYSLGIKETVPMMIGEIFSACSLLLHGTADTAVVEKAVSGDMKKYYKWNED